MLRTGALILSISFGLLPGLSWQSEPMRVHIDTRQTGEPISPYIYGQFIEHLGRCIYGGLWAEMLEDRKFFYPVTGAAPAWTLHRPGESSWEGEGHPYELLTRSPWLILGEPAAVTMVREKAYVGAHTPQITLQGGAAGTGLVQDRLGLEPEKEYIGRVVLAGTPSAAPVEVSLVWGSGAGDRETVSIDRIGPDYQSFPLHFTVRDATDNGRFEIAGRGTGHFLVGAVSLMPVDNVFGWRADTLALLRELDAPVYRWPGGNFVSGYDWRDGIGERDRRPPRKNPAWTGVESNDVGLHEFLDLCRLIEAEPYIAVNTGLGDPESAAEQAEYVNGSADTPMGLLRAQNGYPTPYGVKWWAIGNEMYGDWQLGHMPLEEYVRKHVRVVEAMRSVDPAIEPVAVGAAGEWSRTMLSEAASHMSLISEHLYWQDREDLVDHVAQVPDRIREVAEIHRRYRQELAALQGKDIRIAMDEWNYWYGPYQYGELGTRYFLQDALGIAAGLHEFFRNSDLYFMANYAQTVNVIGAIKTTPTEAEMETTGLVLGLYRHHFGQIPVVVAGGTKPLDIAAAWTADRSILTIAVVNPTDQRMQLDVQLAGAQLTGRSRRWEITGTNRRAHNAPGKPRQVDISQVSVEDAGNDLEVRPLSITLLALELR